MGDGRTMGTTEHTEHTEEGTQRRDAEGAEVRGEDGHPGLGVGKLDAWDRWLARVLWKKSDDFGGWVELRKGVFSSMSDEGDTMTVSRLVPQVFHVEVPRGTGFKLVARQSPRHHPTGAGGRFTTTGRHSARRWNCRLNSAWSADWHPRKGPLPPLNRGSPMPHML